MANHFEANLYTSFLKSGSNNTNVIYSPVLINMILAIFYMATDGPARKELSTVLQYTGKETNDMIAKEFRQFFQKAPTLTPTEDEWYYSPLPVTGPEWHVQTTLYIPTNITIVNNFKSFLTENFGTNIIQLSSYTASDITKQNSMFASRAPNPNVKIISNSILNQKSSIVLANIAFLNASWVNTFVQAATTDSTFTKIGRNNRNNVRTMTQYGWIPYVRLTEMDAHAVELPLKHSNLSMIFIMPLRLNTLEKVLDKLQKTDLRSIVKRMTLYNLRLNIPVFRIEYNPNLIPILRKMGLQKIFQTGQALYTKMINFNGPLSVSSIVQKVFIDVNERGLDIADHTWIGSGSLGNLNLQYNGLDVLRPFFFALIDDEKTYYVGYTKDPKLEYSGSIEDY